MLTISLPRLEGMPQVRGRPTVSYHAQAGAVHFLSAVQCHMVSTAGSRSIDSTLTASEGPLPRTPVNNSSSGGSVTPNEDEQPLPGSAPRSQQPSWVSTPDLRLASNDLNEQHDDTSEDYGSSMSDLYGSLLKGIDADLDSEVLANPPPHSMVTRSVVLRRPNHPATNRVISRLSNVITRGRADVRARLRQLPQRPKDFRQQQTASAVEDNIVAATEFSRQTSNGENNNAATMDDVYMAPCHETSFLETLSPDSPSLPESLSNNQPGTSTNTSYRRLVVPACPSMVASSLVHVQSGKALIIVSGGTGYRCWNNAAKPADQSLSADSSCLLLWKC